MSDVSDVFVGDRSGPVRVTCPECEGERIVHSTSPKRDIVEGRTVRPCMLCVKEMLEVVMEEG